MDLGDPRAFADRDRRYPTPTGDPCPRQVRVDGTVDGSGACFGCGTCMLFGGLLDAVAAFGPAPASIALA